MLQHFGTAVLILGLALAASVVYTAARPANVQVPARYWAGLALVVSGAVLQRLI